MSEWLDIMLEEIARKKQEALRERAELARREAGIPAVKPDEPGDVQEK